MMPATWFSILVICRLFLQRFKIEVPLQCILQKKFEFHIAASMFSVPVMYLKALAGYNRSSLCIRRPYVERRTWQNFSVLKGPSLPCILLGHTWLAQSQCIIPFSDPPQGLVLLVCFCLSSHLMMYSCILLEMNFQNSGNMWHVM